MNSDQIKGAWNLVKGKAKVVLGEVVGDENLKAEGSADKLYGLLHSKLGDAKQVIKSKIDKVRLP
jgi:uncharacterized protein YjbJ (UPF0337 family)